MLCSRRILRAEAIRVAGPIRIGHEGEWTMKTYLIAAFVALMLASPVLADLGDYQYYKVRSMPVGSFVYGQPS